MHRYFYTGPVFAFKNIICDRWVGCTIAGSRKKALSNLMYQYKKSHNLQVACKIVLDESFLTEEEEDIYGNVQLKLEQIEE